MADKLLDDVGAFLDDIVNDLTNLHVDMAQWRNAPYDDETLNKLANLPAGLIDRAQALKADVEKAGEGEKPKAPSKPKPAAKH
jgi:hypothetical protein